MGIARQVVKLTLANFDQGKNGKTCRCFDVKNGFEVVWLKGIRDVFVRMGQRNVLLKAYIALSDQDEDTADFSDIC